MAVCGQSLFGSGGNYIKFGNGEILAIEGSTTAERLGLSELRMPYKQILKSRIILKAGQTNYLLNHLGLGDNATFLAIKATYNSKSVISDDNYIQWSYYDELTSIHTFAQCMILTGNGTNRVKQLYLTNPNTKYPVQLDVMVAIIDDQYSIFTDTLNQSATSFTGLEYTDIKSYVVGESIVFYDKSSPKKPLIYINLTNINSIEASGKILIIDDQSLGTLLFAFLTEYDANQAHSLLNYVLENPVVDIDTISPIGDDISPVLYFFPTAGVGGDYIAFNGATSGVPYDTSYGFTFSTSISLSTYGTVSGTVSVFNKQSLINILVDYVQDNRDGLIGLQPSNLVVSDSSGNINMISAVGTYSVTFNFSDIAKNYLDGVVINLNITS